MRNVIDDGWRVLAVAKELDADVAPVSVRTVRRKTPFDKQRFDAAVEHLLRMAPSPITVGPKSYRCGTGGRRTRAVISLNMAAVQASALHPRPTPIDRFFSSSG